MGSYFGRNWFLNGPHMKWNGIVCFCFNPSFFLKNWTKYMISILWYCFIFLFHVGYKDAERCNGECFRYVPRAACSVSSFWQNMGTTSCLNDTTESTIKFIVHAMIVYKWIYSIWSLFTPNNTRHWDWSFADSSCLQNYHQLKCFNGSNILSFLCFENVCTRVPVKVHQTYYCEIHGLLIDIVLQITNA